MYLRSKVGNEFITFQMYPSVRRFFRELGYKEGDTVSWKFVRPLWEQGYIYTGNSSKESTENPRLSSNYLGDSSAEKPTSDEQSALSEFLKHERRENFTVPSDIHRSVTALRQGKVSKSDVETLLFETGDIDSAFQSIRRFRQSLLTIEDVDVSRDALRYHIPSRSQEIRCVDVWNGDCIQDFILTFKGDSGDPQALKIGKGVLTDWDVYSSVGTTSAHLRDLVHSLPSIVETLVYIPGYDLCLDLWDYDSAADWNLSDEGVEVLELETDRLAQSIGRPDSQSGPYRGHVDSVSGFGYGIIDIDEHRGRILFDLQDLVRRPHPGEVVEFHLHRDDGVIRATDTHYVDISRINRSRSTSGETPSDIANLVEQWSASKYLTWSSMETRMERIGRQRVYASLRAMDQLSLSSVQEVSIRNHRIEYSLDLADSEGYWTCSHSFDNGNLKHILELHPENDPARQAVIRANRIVEVKPLETDADSTARDRYYRSQPRYLSLVKSYLSEIPDSLS